jgi:hypothetical protein
MNASTLSACFGLPLELERRGGRWLAWAKAGDHSGL